MLWFMSTATLPFGLHSTHIDDLLKPEKWCYVFEKLN